MRERRETERERNPLFRIPTENDFKSIKNNQSISPVKNKPLKVIIEGKTERGREGERKREREKERERETENYTPYRVKQIKIMKTSQQTDPGPELVSRAQTYSLTQNTIA